MIQRRFVLGSVLILVGAVLLLMTTGVIPFGTLGIPMILFLLGVFFLHRAFRPDGTEISLFSGTMFSLTGVFFLLKQSVLTRTELRALWPVFMTFGGMALVVYGLRKESRYRISMILPGSAIIVLSLIFLLFSLNVIEQSLASLAARWWPLIFVPLGFLVLLPSRDSSPRNADVSSDTEPDPDSDSGV